RFHFANPRRRPQVVGDAVRPAKAGGGHDFLVINALASIAGLVGMRYVALRGDGAELTVGRHIDLMVRRSFLSDGLSGDRSSGGARGVSQNARSFLEPRRRRPPTRF